MSVPKRVRLLFAVSVGACSFFGEAPISALDWLFTGKGRAALLLVALGIGFWPQLSGWAKEQWLALRPPSKRELKKATVSLAAEYRDYIGSEPPQWTEHMAFDRERSLALDSAETKEERLQVLQDFNVKRFEQDHREKLDIANRFGGKLRLVVSGFEARGMDRQEARALLWEGAQKARLLEVASQLDSLGEQL